MSSRKATNQNIQTCCLCVQKQHGSVLGTGYFAAGFVEIGLQLAHFVFRNQWRLVRLGKVITNARLVETDLIIVREA